MANKKITMAELAEVFTISTTTAFNIPDGCTEIFLKNQGSGTVTWRGSRDKVPNNATSGAEYVTSVITLQAGEAYSYGYIGRGRKGFTVTPNSTTLDISLTF